MSSILFPIPPLSAYCSEIESLPSYLYRISYEHGIYAGEMLRFCEENRTAHETAHLDVRLPKYTTPKELVREGKTTKYIKSLLSGATKQDLNGTTLSFIEDCLGASNGEIVSGFRWCPECFSEQQSTQQKSYFKLIWHLSAISHCPSHRTPLNSCCEFCGDTQTTYMRRYPINLCQQCGTSLAKRNSRLTPKDIRPSWHEFGYDLIVFLNQWADTQWCTLPNDGIWKSVSDLFDYYWRNGREEEFYAAGGRDDLLAVIYRQNSPSLKTARRVAHRLGAPLFDVLAGKAALTTAPLDHAIFCALPAGYLEAQSKSFRDHRKILKKISSLLSSANEPPCINSIAESVGVSVGYLSYRHPTLVKKVTEAHKEYTTQQKLRRLYKAQSLALKFFIDEEYAEFPKSRKQAYKVLKEETGLPKFLLKRAVSTAYNALQSEAN